MSAAMRTLWVRLYLKQGQRAPQLVHVQPMSVVDGPHPDEEFQGLIADKWGLFTDERGVTRNAEGSVGKRQPVSWPGFLNC
jgi:hypothetical protein